MNKQEFEKEYLNEWVPAVKIDFPLLIVAGNYREAKHLADLHRIPRNLFKFINSTMDLDGYTGSVCYYGTWYQTKDSGRINDLIQTWVKQGRLKLVELADHP